MGVQHGGAPVVPPVPARGYGGRMRLILRILLVPLLLCGAIALYGFLEARADPVVRTATIRLPHWPAGQRPVRAALVSDIHVGNAVMDAARLGRIVDQVNALHPDIVLLAGDFIAGHGERNGREDSRSLVAPLSRLRAPLGVVAVPGNHDWWTDPVAVTRALREAHVTVLSNRAVERGPLAIGGIDDETTHHDRPTETIAAMRALPGAPVLMTHSPNFASARLAGAPLLLAGHTHCGQIVLPGIGPVAPLMPLLRQRLCGLYREPGLAVVVTGGVGTSVAPLRIGAPPDLWLLTLGP